MLFIMTSRAHSCGYVAIMDYYCYVVHQPEIWLEVRPRPLKVCGGVIVLAMKKLIQLLCPKLL